MDIEKVKLIPLPEEPSGTYLITKEVLQATGNDLEAVDDAVWVLQVKLGINLAWTVTQERTGFRVTWRPR